LFSFSLFICFFFCNWCLLDLAQDQTKVSTIDSDTIRMRMQIKQRQLTQISTGERSIFRSTYMLKKIRRFIPPYGLKYFHFSWRVQTIGRKLFWLSSRHSTSRISLSHKKKIWPRIFCLVQLVNCRKSLLFYTSCLGLVDHPWHQWVKPQWLTQWRRQPGNLNGSSDG